MIYTVLGIDNNDGHDAGTVPHDEQLEIEPRMLSTIEQIFKVRKWVSARKRVHHGAIKVENSLSVLLRIAPAKNTYITFSKSLSKSPSESGDFVYCERPYYQGSSNNVRHLSGVTSRKINYPGGTGRKLWAG
jgi:hypothetical protein